MKLSCIEYSNCMEFYEYIKEIDINDSNKYYCGFEFFPEQLDEVKFKNAIFQFQAIIIKIEEEKNINYLYFSLHNFLDNKTTITIEFLPLIDNLNIDKCIAILVSKLPRDLYTKVEIDIFKYKLEYISPIIENSSFVKEMEFPYQDDNFTRLLYSKFI